MKRFRVRYWLQDQDGQEEQMGFDTREEALAFYDSLDGMAEIQEYDEERHCYEVVLYPTFEF